MRFIENRSQVKPESLPVEGVPCFIGGITENIAESVRTVAETYRLRNRSFFESPAVAADVILSACLHLGRSLKVKVCNLQRSVFFALKCKRKCRRLEFLAFCTRQAPCFGLFNIERKGRSAVPFPSFAVFGAKEFICRISAFFDISGGQLFRACVLLSVNAPDGIKIRLGPETSVRTRNFLRSGAEKNGRVDFHIGQGGFACAGKIRTGGKSIAFVFNLCRNRLAVFKRKQPFDVVALRKRAGNGRIACFVLQSRHRTVCLVKQDSVFRRPEFKPCLRRQRMPCTAGTVN